MSTDHDRAQAHDIAYDLSYISHAWDEDVVDLDKLAERIAAALSAARAEGMTARWISVNDNLPDADRDVIVCVDYMPWPRVYKFHNGKFYGWGKLDERVTHWMPLPELPDAALIRRAG